MLANASIQFISRVMIPPWDTRCLPTNLRHPMQRYILNAFQRWLEKLMHTRQLVRLIREAGGIPFVKTNLSQTLMFFECVNPMWGRTLNPYSDSHTSGGSTGGEAALLAMDGSALGWGNDVGGSMRIPAGYCGVYSMKPAHGRISASGLRGMCYMG